MKRVQAQDWRCWPGASRIVPGLTILQELISLISDNHRSSLHRLLLCMVKIFHSADFCCDEAAVCRFESRKIVQADRERAHERKRYKAKVQMHEGVMDIPRSLSEATSYDATLSLRKLFSDENKQVVSDNLLGVKTCPIFEAFLGWN